MLVKSTTRSESVKNFYRAVLEIFAEIRKLQENVNATCKKRYISRLQQGNSTLFSCCLRELRDTFWYHVKVILTKERSLYGR